MRIKKIIATRHRVPLDKPYHPVWSPVSLRHIDVDLVSVETDSGVIGTGPGPLAANFDDFSELFIGQDPLQLERHHRIIESLSFHHAPCWGLDLALWDLVGQIHDMPVWKMLGAKETRLRAFASIATSRPPEELHELAQDLSGDGFPALKLRLSDGDWRTDLKRAEAIRAGAPDAVLMVDCGQGAPYPWQAAHQRAPEDSLEFMTALADLDLLWVEDPLHRADYKGLAGLRENTGLQIAGGAHIRDLHELRNLIMRAGVSVLRTDMTRMGGLTGLLPYLRRAKAKGLMFSPSTWDNGAVLMANAHLAAASGACPCFEFPLDPPRFVPTLRDHILAKPILPDQDGWIDLSDAPGLGLDLNQDYLKDTEAKAA